MRWDNLYVAGVGAYLPARVETAEEAIAAGRYTRERLELNGYRAAHVAEPAEIGPVLASIAGRQAVQRSGVPHDEFAVVAHSYINHQGYDLWVPASFVQRETVGGTALAFEVRAGCNSFLAAVEAAASFIAARPSGPSAALVTGGDSFRLPYIDRWASHEQNVDSDGGAALVLSTRGGFARVRATCSYSDPSLEPTSRPAAPPTDAPFQSGRTIEPDTTLHELMMSGELDMDDVVARISAGVQHSLKQVLHEAEIELSDVRFFLHQQLAETIAEHGIYGLLGIERERTAYDWGKDHGMVGVVDTVLGLDHVLAERDPQPGDFVVMQGAGAGYVWTTVVLEILERPSWV